MNKFCPAFFVVLLATLFGCTPLDKPEVPDQENSEENYTSEIPTEENGYTVDSAGDKDDDTIVSGNAIYWENEGWWN